MTEIEFKAIAAQGFNRIPLLAESFADLETPLSLYLKLAHKPFSFLLESVVGGERFGRYSFIGLPASTMLRSTATGAEVVKNGQVIERFEGNPLDFVDQYRKRFRVAVRPGLPRFCGGLAGYFAYDAVRFIEPRLAGVSKPDPVGVPDILLLLTEELAIIDNIAGKIYLMVYADPSESEAYQKATKRLRDLRVKLRQPVDVPVSSGSYETPTERDFPKEKYLQAVLKAKDYIMAGDMMQVQIGQVLRKQFRDSPLTLYRALRSINPSPYMYLYNFGDFHVVGASPEILVRQEHEPDGDRITIRPLAGTRQRGGTPVEDEAIAAELLADPKERAEHVMLIDLARNDIGRIAEIGSVQGHRPDGDREVLARDAHRVATSRASSSPAWVRSTCCARPSRPARCRARPRCARWRSSTSSSRPSAASTAAPAATSRFVGDLDLAIAIRTGVVKDGMLYVQAAAGVVADSVPESEWQETENKARAVLRAAELVQAGLE